MRRSQREGGAARVYASCALVPLERGREYAVEAAHPGLRRSACEQRGRPCGEAVTRNSIPAPGRWAIGLMCEIPLRGTATIRGLNMYAVISMHSGMCSSLGHPAPRTWFGDRCWQGILHTRRDARPQPAELALPPSRTWRLIACRGCGLVCRGIFASTIAVPAISADSGKSSDRRPISSQAVGRGERDRDVGSCLTPSLNGQRRRRSMKPGVARHWSLLRKFA